MQLLVVVVKAMAMVSAGEAVLGAVTRVNDPEGAVAERSPLMSVHHSAAGDWCWHCDGFSHFHSLLSSGDCCWRRSCAMNAMNW